LQDMMVAAPFHSGTNKLTKHLKVAVLDHARGPDVLSEALPKFPDLRVSTVIDRSIKFFESSRAWSEIAPHAREFGSMQVWDTANLSVLGWEASDIGAERMGAVVENSVITSACCRIAKECPNVEMLWPYKISGTHLARNAIHGMWDAPCSKSDLRILSLTASLSITCDAIIAPTMRPKPDK
jgi:2-polyprenyl-6-methoxyphenol hydroxylase-like FAD-dependent oxidoreductase